MLTGTFNGLAGLQPDVPVITDDSAVNAGLSVDTFNENYMILDLWVADIDISIVDSEVGMFTLLSVPDMGYTTEVGSPKLPCMSWMLAVPNSVLTFEILSENYYETDAGQIYPVQEPGYDGYENVNDVFAINSDVYSANEFYPGRTFGVVDTGFIRVIPFARICFYPVQYNPATGKARIYDHFQVKLQSLIPNP